MDVYWLAIDKKHTSYEELKRRKVIAQGWSALGDLRTLCRVSDNDLFCSVIQNIGDNAYDNHPEKSFWFSEAKGDRKDNRCPNVLWLLMNIKENDLIVGKEGAIVKGICEVEKNGTESYRFDGDYGYEYAQTVGFPVEWIDWDEKKFGFTPVPPPNMLGIRRIDAEREQVIEAWKKVNKKT